MDYRFVASFKSQAKTYEVARMNYNDNQFRQVEQKIFDQVDNFTPSTGRITTDMESIYANLPKDMVTNVSYSGDYIKTIILFRLYGKG